MNSRYPYFRRNCDEACLGLGFYPVSKQILFNVLRRIGSNTITYENVFLVNNRALLLEIQVNYVEDIIIKRDKSNLGISRK